MAAKKAAKKAGNAKVTPAKVAGRLGNEIFPAGGPGAANGSAGRLAGQIYPAKSTGGKSAKKAGGKAMRGR